MINSLVMIAALAAGADGDYYEYSPEPTLVDVNRSRESERSVSTIVTSMSDFENGGPEQDSTLNVEEEVGAFEDCSCCYESSSYGHFGFHHRYYPSPYYSPGNMSLHFPYVAEPKNYYYFRPYNWFHILDQQKEVVLYGGDPRHPYKNDLFQEVYREIEAK